MADLNTPPNWFKSSHSSSSSCVEVAVRDDEVWIRDSKNPGTVLSVDRDVHFVRAVRNGDFDL